MPATFTIPTVFTAINKFSAPVQNMSRSMSAFANKSTSSLARIEKGFSRLLSPLASFNRMLAGAGLYIGLFTLVTLLRGAVGVVADFEEAQLNIASVTGRSVQQNKALSQQARQMAVDYGLAAVEVSKLQTELIKLGLNQKPGGMQNILDATPAISLGAKAIGAPADELAKIVGSTASIFGRSYDDVVDIFAKGIDVSALDFQSFSTMLSNSQQAWKLGGKDLESLITSMAILSNNFVHSASAGTALKNITIDNAVAMKTLEEQMAKIAKSKNPLFTGNKMYGRKAITSAIPLSRSLDDGSLAKLNDLLTGTFHGYTKILDAQKSIGINYKLGQAKAAWNELILSIDDGTGKFAQAARDAIDVFRAMNLITSGSEVATIALKQMNPLTIAQAESMIVWAKWIFRVAGLIIAMKIAILAWTAAVWLSSVAMAAYNIALGITGALSLTASVAIGRSTIALYAYKATLWIATAAQWAWNAAMTANPIGLIIVGIAALIGLIALVVNKWNEWGAALSIFLGPLGYVISVIQSFRRNWDMVVEAFKTGGILGAIKAIGKVLFDAILMPIQQLFGLLARLPGALGGSAQKMHDLIGAYRNSLGVNTSTDESGGALSPKLNPGLAQGEMIRETIRSESKNVKVDFGNVPRGASITGDKDVVGDITPEVGSTFGMFGKGSLLGDWQ